MTNAPTDLTGLEIAIIGMAGRFPGASDVDAFWENLARGVESITTFTDGDLRAAGVDLDVQQQPTYVRRGAILDDVEHFDAAFFELSPREAQLMDPQHRIFLECAWEALEQAGYSVPGHGPVGVYAGANMNTYVFNLLTSLDPTESMGNLPLLTGNDKDYLTTRVSYKLNLHGPSVSVQTACSTSLVAIHLACRAVLSGECRLALAGGISIRVPQKSGYVYEPDGIYSPDGHCRAFDADAQGTTFGSGAGVVVLKRLEDALEDGDTIHAVIKGSAINNDGAAKIGYTAPGVEGQREVIMAALSFAEVAADTIGYVEAHGTATPLGDPVEVAALTEAFRGSTSRSGFCALGSVKSNIGHLDTAAGVTGLIKTIQALKHQQIPASLHFQRPNPQIDFADSPFYVNAELRPWASSGAPRRAGVSSFGVGGTNAHVIVEEAPVRAPCGSTRPYQLLLLSAKTPSALRAQTVNLARHLRQHADLDLADVAYTLQVGRRSFHQRQALVCRDRDDALAALEAVDPQRLLVAEQAASNRPVVMLFPGQGTQYVNMARELYEHEPVFRAQVERCCTLFLRHLGLDLRTILYPSPAASSTAAQQIDQTAYTQPALFTIEYALAQLWRSWGVQPSALLGHSIGEYVAATLAGVFTLEDAVGLVAARGRLIQQLPSGAMLSVALSEQALQSLLGTTRDLAVAAVNGPQLCVVSGTSAAMAELQQRLDDQGIEWRRLHTSHAFHSPMLEPILRPFLLELKRVRLQPPQLPIISNVTGTWLSSGEATDPYYWVRQLQQTVRFADGLETLLAESDAALLEVGPGHTLISFARQQSALAGRVAVSSLPHARDEQPAAAALLTALGKLWLAGVALDWSSLYRDEQRRRVPLPTYPFERQHFWIAPQQQAVGHGHAQAARSSDPADWFSLPAWRRTVAPLPVEQSALSQQARHWLVFMDREGIGAQLVERLEQLGQTVTQVQPGVQFACLQPRSYTLDITQAADYRALLDAVRAADRLPERIVHLWNVTDNQPAASADLQDLGFYSLLALAQALGDQPLPEPIQIDLISTGMQHVAGEDEVQPEKATSLGPCNVIPQEYPQLACRSIDLTLPGASARRRHVVNQLLAELAAAPADRIVAYRGAERWVEHFEPVQLAASDGWRSRLRERGVYLITGGLGGLGLLFATFLAEAVQARLVLLGRTALPERPEWTTWLSTHDRSDPVSQRIEAIQAIEQLGAEVLILNADVADQGQLQSALDQAQVRFGDLNGVIHAAGVAGGGIIQLKTRDAVTRVVDPKLQGARNLQALLDTAALDFFVLFSSTIAHTGSVGQVDYCAANAFLDAFAAANVLDSGSATTVIDWDEWATVGMAAQAGPPPPTPLEHPLLDTVRAATDSLELALTSFNSDRHWVLAEHRVAGHGALPGTAYLEMAHAVGVRHAAGQPLTLRDVRFLQPLMVVDGDTASVYTILEPDEDGFSFTVGSQASDGQGWYEHARGRVSAAPAETAPALDLAALRAALQPADRALFTESTQQSADALVQWGPRWRTLTAVYAGPQQALALLELPATFAQDTAMLTLHPALLDLATSYVCLMTGKTNYLPLAYQAVHVLAPLPPTIYSYVRWSGELEHSQETITLEIVITDVAGQPLVTIEGFTLINDELFTHTPPAEASQIALQLTSNPVYSRVAATLTAGSSSDGRALTPTEGLDAFKRVLSRPDLVQIVVAKQPLATLIAQANAPDHSGMLKQIDATGGAQHPRPQIQTPYQAPRNEREQIICEIWQQVLGVAQIGIHDNFFDLGGHSLLAAQIVERLRSTFQLNVPLSKIVEVPTVIGLAQVIDTLQAELEAREADEILAQLAALSDDDVEAELLRRTER